MTLVAAGPPSFLRCPKWLATVGEIEIVAREQRKGLGGMSVELIYWRPKKKNVIVGVSANRRIR
jgi:hypothetical protein